MTTQLHDLAHSELLQMYRATLALKDLHAKDGSYSNYYERRCEELEAEILKRMERLQ